VAIDWDVRTGARRLSQVRAQDLGSVCRWNLIEADRLVAAVAQCGAAAGGAHVADPVRLAKYRDQGSLAVVTGGHDGKRDHAAGLASRDFERGDAVGPYAGRV